MNRVCSKCGRIHPRGVKCVFQFESVPAEKKEDEIKKLRRKNAWTKKSIQIREQGKYLCEYCLKHGMINYNQIEVHHIVPIKENTDIWLDDGNLIALCREHHEQAEKGEIPKEELYEIIKERNKKQSEI